LAAHFTAGRGPAFELVLELGNLSSPRATAGDLRARGEAELPAAMEHFVRRVDALARDPSRELDFRSRLAVLALQGMRISKFSRPLAAAPVFDRYDDAGARDSAALVDLRAAMVDEGGRRVAFCLRPEDDPQLHDLRAQPAILDDELRAALQRTLELELRTPALRPDAATRGRWVRALARRATDLRNSVAASFRGRPQIVAEEDFSSG